MIPRAAFMLTSATIRDRKLMSQYELLLTELRINSLLKTNYVWSFACEHGERNSP
jgi:hypothetical protein